MNTKQALRTLREVGTLRIGAQRATVIDQAATGTPVATAVDRLAQRSNSSTERPWMPPADFLLPLP